MIDLTPLINAAIAVMATAATVFLIPWLKRKTNEQDRAELLAWAEIAVAAAQQLYHHLDGADRKVYVLEFLQGKGYDVDSLEVDAAIEAAVLALHQALEVGDV